MKTMWKYFWGIGLFACMGVTAYFFPEIRPAGQWFKALRDVMEMIYFAITPLLAYLAWRALVQIKVTRDIARNQATREAFTVAAVKTVEFSETVIPQLNLFSDAWNKGEYPLLRRAAEQSSQQQEFKISAHDADALVKEVESHEGLVLTLANKIEAIAMFFTCGLADCETAFRPLSATFCSSVERLMPFLLIANISRKQYSCTLELYNLWTMAIQKEKNAQQAAHHQKLADIKVPVIKPIGID